MALSNNLLKPGMATVVGLGIAAAVLTPIILPAVAGAARPLAKRALKTGIIIYEKGRETAAEISEVFEDLAAEARAELEQEGFFQAPPSDEVFQASSADAEEEFEETAA